MEVTEAAVDAEAVAILMATTHAVVEGSDQVVIEADIRPVTRHPVTVSLTIGEVVEALEDQEVRLQTLFISSIPSSLGNCVS